MNKVTQFCTLRKIRLNRTLKIERIYFHFRALFSILCIIKHLGDAASNQTEIYKQALGGCCL